MATVAAETSAMRRRVHVGYANDRALFIICRDDMIVTLRHLRFNVTLP